MNLLALDTSTEFLSLALQCHQQLLTYHENVGPKASEQILPQIQLLLKQANIQLADLDGIAYGAGPGAFTGVRVAVGVTQGLAFGAKLPVVGINTLLAVAQASGHIKVIVCLDARMGEVYHAVFSQTENGWQELMPASVCKPEAVPVVDGGDWVGAGSGWATYGDVLSQVYQENVVQSMPEAYPVATATLALAEPIFEAGAAQVANQASPIYIRNRVALTTQEREQGLRL